MQRTTSTWYVLLYLYRVMYHTMQLRTNFMSYVHSRHCDDGCVACLCHPAYNAAVLDNVEHNEARGSKASIRVCCFDPVVLSLLSPVTALSLSLNEVMCTKLSHLGRWGRCYVLFGPPWCSTMQSLAKHEGAKAVEKNAIVSVLFPLFVAQQLFDLERTNNAIY